MKKILISIVSLLVIVLSNYTFVFASSIDLTLEENNAVLTNQSDIQTTTLSTSNVPAERPQPVITEMTQSKRDEFFSITNIISIILISVGIVQILLGIAILIRCK